MENKLYTSLLQYPKDKAGVWSTYIKGTERGKYRLKFLCTKSALSAVTTAQTQNKPEKLQSKSMKESC